METNPLMARRRISGRERLQKIATALLFYALVMGAVWIVNNGQPAVGSRAFYLAIALSVVCLAVVLRVAFHRIDTARSKEGMSLVRMRIDDDRAGRNWITRVGFNLFVGLMRIVFVVGLLVSLFGVYVFGRQLFTYATEQVWLDVSVSQVIGAERFSTMPDWIAGASEWFPASLFFMALGVLIGGFGASLAARAILRRVSASR